MKNFFKVVLLGLLLVGLSSVTLAAIDTSNWQKVELKDDLPMQFILPPDMKQTKVENDGKGNWRYEFRDEKENKAVNVNLIFLAANGKKMGSKYPLEAGTDEMRGGFKGFVQEKSPTIEKLDYVKLASGRVVLMGKVKDAPIMEIVGLSDSYLISMRVGVYDEDKDTIIDTIFQILESFNY